ncbi:hypothetical protein BG000_011206 [Podila horticola]|nr:hypothetical protein BG000_011206 [Podila horticola]
MNSLLYSERAINCIKFSLGGPHFGHDKDDSDKDDNDKDDSDSDDDQSIPTPNTPSTPRTPSIPSTPSTPSSSLNSTRFTNAADAIRVKLTDESSAVISSLSSAIINPNTPADTTNPSVLTEAQQLKLMQEQRQNEMELHCLLQTIKATTALKIPEDQRITS